MREASSNLAHADIYPPTSVLLGSQGHVIFVCPTFLGDEVDCSMHLLCIISRGCSIGCCGMADDRSVETLMSILQTGKKD